ncbi:hypothetical protein QEH52_07540 [Coraliomargarita sp. SDUM461003]|uniref:RiboL-PSP-HEPN domain-containing protein n=1 Tax=Thalassobacterium maritimum TaxID=3041265 RepID=A0ABU1AT60_9BACT|nr:hypothetical protein [Coraliomargarita sp. SDUM461003]
MLEKLNFELPSREHVDALLSDQSYCAELIKGDFENQCLRRVYCRTNLTLIEGVISYLKLSTYQFNQSVLHTFKNMLDLYAIQLDVPFFQDVVPLSEAQLLLDKQVAVASNGEIRSKPVFLDFKTNFKFTFQMVDRVFKMTCSPNYGSIRKEWDQLQRAVKVRNRITHPKVGVSLDISDVELDALARSAQWFLDLSGLVFSEIGESMERNQIALATSTEPLLEKALADVVKLLAVYDMGKESSNS